MSESIATLLQQRILVLDGGRLAGLGTHDELLATCSIYQRLWDMQLMPGPETPVER